MDDIIAKSKESEDHLSCLRKLFDRLRRYKLRLNPNKCVFGVSSGKLLGYIISQRGIEVDPSKARAIIDMPPCDYEGSQRTVGTPTVYQSIYCAVHTHLRADLQASTEECADQLE